MNYPHTKFHRLKLLLSILFFLLISYSLFLIANTPVNGYELSIYSATPKIFWVAIIFGLFTGLFLIVSSLYHNSKMWILGIFTIIFCNYLLISLPALRGYILLSARGDSASYIGMSKDVSEFGTFGSNFYPITSILISQLNQLSGISTITISKYLPSIFFIIYFLSIYCWSKYLIPDRKFVLCSTIACMPILFSNYPTIISHMYLSISLLPFFLYFLERNLDYRFKFFSIIFSILIPFVHPVTGIIVLVYVISLFISEKFYFTRMRNISMSLVLLYSTSLIAWFIQQYSLLRSIKAIFLRLEGLLKGELNTDVVQHLVNRLGIKNAIRHILLTTTDEFLFYILSFFAIFFIIRKRRIFAENFFKPLIFLLSSILTTLILLFTVWLHSDRLRNLNSSVIMTLPLVGFLLYYFLLKNKKREMFLVLSLIFISVIISIFSLYPSPIIMRPNDQVTISDINGMDWIITQKDTELKTADILSPIFRYADLIYGNKFRMERKDLGGLSNRLYLPDHFGFNENNIFPIDEDRYLVITEFDIIGFTELWKYMDRFRKEDFLKVDFRTNVDKIYENGEFRSYFVHKYD